jgi:hypothetical protein
MKLEKYAEAVKAFDKALTNDRNAQTLALKQKAEKLKVSHNYRNLLSSNIFF